MRSLCAIAPSLASWHCFFLGGETSNVQSFFSPSHTRRRVTCPLRTAAHGGFSSFSRAASISGARSALTWRWTRSGFDPRCLSRALVLRDLRVTTCCDFSRPGASVWITGTSAWSFSSDLPSWFFFLISSHLCIGLHSCMKITIAFFIFGG